MDATANMKRRPFVSLAQAEDLRLQYRARPSHHLSLSTARAWVQTDILRDAFEPGVTGRDTPYTRWRFTLEQWVNLRVNEGHVTAATLILELLKAGDECRAYGTPKLAERVAQLWVRCHEEAGVLCVECRP